MEEEQYTVLSTGKWKSSNKRCSARGNGRAAINGVQHGEMEEEQ